MTLEFIDAGLPGAVLLKPQVFEDPRGFFMETFHARKYAIKGIPTTFVQDNHSRSQHGTLRGLHYQLKQAQGKLIYVVTGEIYDVCVDIRRGSPHFGQSCVAVLSAENHHQLYVPEGFAHGFVVLSPFADVIYKCTRFYDPADEYGLVYNDPDLKIEWPVSSPILSDKDRQNPTLSRIARENLPGFDAEKAP